VELHLLAGAEPAVRNLVFNGEATRHGKRRRSQRFVEYSLLLALVAIIALVAVKGVGSELSVLFATVSSSL